MDICKSYHFLKVFSCTLIHCDSNKCAMAVERRRIGGHLKVSRRSPRSKKVARKYQENVQERLKMFLTQDRCMRCVVQGQVQTSAKTVYLLYCVASANVPASCKEPLHPSKAPTVIYLSRYTQGRNAKVKCSLGSGSKSSIRIHFGTRCCRKRCRSRTLDISRIPAELQLPFRALVSSDRAANAIDH